MAIINDTNTKSVTNWSSKRNQDQRLRHRPHIVNTANNRGVANVRYYSSVDADIYFGDLFVDEVSNITWQITENTLPIFGYNSYTFDDIAVGSRIVQGQFAVNFTQANYLMKVGNTLKKISRVTYGEDIPAKSGFSDSERIRRNTPIWDMGFDIVIGYGEKRGDSFDEITVLDCCQLTGCSQILDSEGYPIQEVYTFVARDIKETVLSSSESIPEITIPGDGESDSSSLRLMNSIINIKDSNSYINIDYQSTGSLNEAVIQIKGVDNKVFAISKALIVKSNSLIYNLKADEKLAIAQYCSRNDISKVNATITYKIKNGEHITTNEENIVLNVSR